MRQSGEACPLDGTPSHRVTQISLVFNNGGFSAVNQTSLIGNQIIVFSSDRVPKYLLTLKKVFAAISD